MRGVGKPRIRMASSGGTRSEERRSGVANVGANVDITAKGVRPVNVFGRKAGHAR